MQLKLPDNYLISNTGSIALCRLLSAFSGAALDAVVLSTFGIGIETDAFFSALAVPLLIVAVLEVQAPNVLIPAFMQNSANEGREGMWHLMRCFMTMGFLFFSFIALLLAISSALVVPALVPGLPVASIGIATRLFRILIWLVPIRFLDTMLTASLFSNHQYSIPSITKLVTNTVAAVLVLLSGSHFGIYALAFGHVSGSIAAVGMLWISAARRGFRYSPAWGIQDQQVRKVLRLFAYPMLGHGLSASRELLENFLASFLNAGSLSAFRYASRLVQSISSVFVGGVTTPSLSLISHHAVEGDYEAMKESFIKSIKVLVLIAVPLATWLAFMVQPMLMLLFQRGRFSAADAALTAQVIAIMVPYIFLSRLVTLCQAPFFATLNNRIPAVSTLISFVTHAAILIPLSRILAIYAFPIASAVFPLFTSLYLLAKMHTTFGSFANADFKQFVERTAIAILFTAFAFEAAKRLLAPYVGDGLYSQAAAFVVPSVLGSCVLLAALAATGIVTPRHLRQMRPALKTSAS